MKKVKTTKRLTREELSPSELELVRLMSALNYGFVTGFEVRNGQPILDPRPRISHQDMFGYEIDSRPSVWDGRYLHPIFSDAIIKIRALGDGEVSWIEVIDGLPIRGPRVPEIY